LQPASLKHVAITNRSLLKVVLLISGRLRLPTKALYHSTVALRLRVARRAVRIDLHTRRRIRRSVRIILTLHIGLPSDVGRRRQRCLITGRRVRAVHAVAVDLACGRAAMRRQGSLHLLRETAQKRYVISFCREYSFYKRFYKRFYKQFLNHVVEWYYTTCPAKSAGHEVNMNVLILLKNQNDIVTDLAGQVFLIIRPTCDG